MTVKNISRPRALDLVPEKDSCWVSIQEPSNEHITCELDKLPNLKIKFWDIVIPITDVRTKEIIPPPSEQDAKDIVDFILSHPNKNVIVNCKLGYSRSAAVSKFCRDVLKYEWIEGTRVMRDGECVDCKPNSLLYNLMCKYYNELNR